MDVHTVFPIRMANRLGRARHQELPWYEQVVGHGVCGQVGEITVTDCAELGGVGGDQDLLTDVPMMAVPSSA